MKYYPACKVFNGNRHDRPRQADFGTIGSDGGGGGGRGGGGEERENAKK